MVRRLSAGGSWIRTFGPSRAKPKPLSSGTEGSNPAPSSEDPAANSVQTLPPWRLPRPRRPPYFGPSRTAGAPRVASEGIVAITVDAHGCTSARWYRGTTCCRGRSSAPPGSLGPSPWGRASGSLQGRVRPCSCSPPLVTSSSILRVIARSPVGPRAPRGRCTDVRTAPAEPCEIYSRLITIEWPCPRARVRGGPREQRERERGRSCATQAMNRYSTPAMKAIEPLNDSILLRDFRQFYKTVSSERGAEYFTSLSG